MLAKRDTVVQLLQAQRIPVAVDGVNLVMNVAVIFSIVV